MAVTSQTSGSQALTLATPATVATISVAGVYEFLCDLNPLTGFDEYLELSVEMKVLTGSTRRRVDEFVIGRGTDLNKVFRDIVRPSLFEIAYILTQTGGTGRTIDWQIHKLQ